MDYLPVTVRKGASQVKGLSGDHYQLRQLCPRGKLLAVLEEAGVLRVRDFAGASTRGVIESQLFSSFLWVNDSGSRALDHHQQQQPPLASDQESLLLAVTRDQCIHFYTVGHRHPQQKHAAGEKVVDESLLIQKVASIENSEIVNTLQTYQLSKVLDSIQPVATHNNIAILLANGNLILRLALPPHASSPSITSAFSIDPNMEDYSDEALPHYVAGVTALHCCWPLVFVLTEDGIVLIHDIRSAKCVGAVNVVEYCKMVGPLQPETEDLLQHMSTSSFKLFTVSFDLTKLAVATDTNQILLVNLPHYFHYFPTHYSKQFLNPRAVRQSPYPKKGTQLTSKIVHEGDSERLQYGGLTPRHRALGQNFLGPFTGHHSLTSRIKTLNDRVNGLDPASGQGLSFAGCCRLALDGTISLPVQERQEERKWYESKHTARGLQVDSDIRTYDVNCFTSIRRPTHVFATPVLDADPQAPSSPSFLHVSRMTYPHSCLLPPADSHITQGSSLLHLDCGHKVVVAYYGAGNIEEAITSSHGSSRPYLWQAVLRSSISTVVVYKTLEQSYSVSKLPNASWLIVPSQDNQPIFLVSDNAISVAAFSLTQEDFVAKVLMYGSASVAEEVCYLNRWDQCALPLNALETALDLRQLDVISFFLRNRDDAKGGYRRKRSESVASEESSVLSPPPPLPPDQLDAAIHLIIASIKRSHNSEHNRQFAEQLLNMALSFILWLIKSQTQVNDGQVPALTTQRSGNELSTSNSSSEDSTKDLPGGACQRSIRDTSETASASGSLADVFVSPSDLTSHVHVLRQFLPCPLTFKGHTEEEHKEEEEMFAELLEEAVRNEAWDQLSKVEVIKSSLLSAQFPLAQSYLIYREEKKKHQMDHSTDSGSESPSVELSSQQHDSPSPTPSMPLGIITMSSLLEVGIGLVMKALNARNIKQAIFFLERMGVSVKRNLRYIFLHTLQRQARDFLADELAHRGWLPANEAEAMMFLHVLERYYQHSSFSQAVADRQLCQPSPTSSVEVPAFFSIPGLSPSLILARTGDIVAAFPESFGGDHPLQWEDSKSSVQPDSLYVQVPVYVVLEWDSALRHQILMEAFVLMGKSNEAECHRLVPTPQQLLYHISHHNSKTTLWLLHELDPSIAHQLVMSGDAGRSQYIREILLDELAQMGVFEPVQEENMPSLLYRIGRVHALCCQPHPLSSTDHGGGNSRVKLFHKLFISYLINRDLYNFLYLYLDEYQLALNQSSISELGMATTDLPAWVSVLLHCRLAAKNTSEPSHVFSSSLACSLYLHGCNSVAECLRNGHILVAIATLMYAPVPLEETMDPSNRGQPWYVDPDQLKGAFAPYPTLQAAVFPPPTTQLTPADSQDITVYELLKGSVPFDVSRLFYWQSTNTITTIEDDSESSQECPHFSKTSLSHRYGVSERLTDLFYLQHGQPSFALANFVASRLVHCANPGRRVDHAVTQVYQLALADFTNSKLTASCAAFVEMLSRDSILLRVDTQTAARLLLHQESLHENSHGSSREEESEQNRLASKTKITSQLTQLYKTPGNMTLALGIMHKLEKATIHLVEASRVGRCSKRAEGEWSLVQAFCRCHGLSPSTAFLKECAEEGEWLPLLCHAQLYNVSLSEVLKVVNKHFSEPSVQEHLRLALSSMDSNLPPLPQRVPENQRGGPHARLRRKRSSSQSSQKESRETLMRRDTDLRASFYTRVGVQQSQLSKPRPENLHLEAPVDVEVTISPSLIANLQGYQPAIQPSDIHDDLFTVLFKCQDHAHSWRALLAYSIALHRPLLAILAACYEDTSILDCMCAWLCATLHQHAIRKIAPLLMIAVDEGTELNFTAELQWRTWTQQDFGILLLAAMLEVPCPASQFPLLFNYFDKMNPLFPFMKFHEEFVLRLNLPKSETFLTDFLLQIDKCTRLETYFGLVGDTQWAEEIATTFANHMIVSCPTLFERGRLLHLLAKSKFGENFTCQTLNYSQLHELSVITEQAGLLTVPAFKISDNFSSSLSSASPSNLYTVRVRINSDHVLGVMVENSQFAAARSFAEVARVPVAEVTLKEVESKYQRMLGTGYWQFQPARMNFWLQCNQSFVEDNVSPEMAAEFMENVVQAPNKMPSSSSSPITANERTLLLLFALRWRKEAGLSEEDASSLREIWLSHIHSIMAQGSNSNGNHCALSDLLKDSTLPPTVAALVLALVVSAEKEAHCESHLSQLLVHDPVPVAMQITDSTNLELEEQKVLDLVMGRLLNAGLVSQARNLANLFDRESMDLTIALSCIQLAQGKMSPDRLTEDVIAILSVKSRRRLTETQLREESFGLRKASVEVLRILLQLLDRATHARKCCECVYSCYKIGVVLQVPYEIVIDMDRLEILANVLSSSHPDKYLLAKSFVSSSNMQSKEVAAFLSGCISASLNFHVGGSEHQYAHVKVYNPRMSTSEFMELAQLCSDQTILGSHLLSLSRSLASDEQQSEDWLWMQVKMISRAHDCYTLACSVDGIAEVLKAAREITSVLHKGRYYKLMVQLLTGVGRFHEMSYIIKLLLDSDVFESLVHPGVEKMEQLRVALLDYLRKYRRHDNEKMQMVALKFGMYRELAQAREEQAIKELEKLKHKHITPDNVSVHVLKRIFSDFRDAAKVYMLNNCLSNAERCYSQARLVALQLSLLQSGKCVLNLDPRAVHKFMEEQPFTEALIVADAYKKTTLADWVSPLYKRVVLAGDMRYLSEFKAVFTLTPIIMQELASRYMLDKTRPSEATNNMKRLLGHCNNLPLKHKLAQQLDMQEALGLPTVNDGFLKDIAKL